MVCTLYVKIIIIYIYIYFLVGEITVSGEISHEDSQIRVGEYVADNDIVGNVAFTTSYNSDAEVTTILMFIIIGDNVTCDTLLDMFGEQDIFDIFGMEYECTGFDVYINNIFIFFFVWGGG